MKTISILAASVAALLVAGSPSFADAPEQPSFRARLFRLLAEARRRGADPSGWSEITQFAHVRELRDFVALAR